MEVMLKVVPNNKDDKMHMCADECEQISEILTKYDDFLRFN